MNITIVGLGVIGGSFALALKDKGVGNVWGIDIDEETLSKAKNMEIINEGYTHAEIALANSDIVILCVYPRLVKKFVKDNSKYFKEGSIITDTSGIKHGLIEEVNALLPENVDFIFGHPMAGRERKGIDFASEKVYKGANYIITPNERNKEENIGLIHELLLKAGFGTISRLCPKEHDKQIAYTSQLPHAIAVSLINSESFQDETGKFIGDSFRELTRIAKINENLWCELFMENKENLIKQIEFFENELDKLKDSLLNDEDEKLKDLFRKSSKRREHIS
ncbi:prephenate dehydrogenase [Clostridium sp. DL1XJH146]